MFIAIQTTGMRSRLAKIPGYGTVFTQPDGSQGYTALQNPPNGPTRVAVLAAFADSFRVRHAVPQVADQPKVCWIIGCAVIGFSLIVRSRLDLFAGQALTVPSSQSSPSCTASNERTCTPKANRTKRSQRSWRMPMGSLLRRPKGLRDY